MCRVTLSALNKHLMIGCFSKSVRATSKLSRCIEGDISSAT